MMLAPIRTLPQITKLGRSGNELEFFYPQANRCFDAAKAEVEALRQMAGLPVVQGDDFSGWSVVRETLLGHGDCGPMPGYASVELRSPILTGAAGLRARYCGLGIAATENIFTDRFCGLHHTISTVDGAPTLPQIANVYLGFKYNLAAYQQSIGDVRTEIDACNRPLILTADDWRGFSSVRQAQEATSRNSPLSLWSLQKYGAFELRGRGACAARRDMNGVIQAIAAEVNFITALHYVPWPEVTWQNAYSHCQGLEALPPQERGAKAKALIIA